MTRSKGREGMRAPIRSHDCALVYPLIHPASCPDESPIGYLVRVAELNRYGSTRWMCAGGQLPRLSELHLYQGLLAGAGWTGWGTETSSISTAVCVVDQSDRLGRLRYCPACIRETQRWKAAWHLKASVVCAEHGGWLRDTCPACDSPLSFKSRSTKLCKCGADLSESALCLAPDTVRRQQEWLERGSVSGSLIAAGHNLDLQMRSQLILLFSRFVGRDGVGKTGIDTRVLQMDTAADVMTLVADVLFGGTEGFTRFLGTSFSVGASEQGERRLNRFYKAFYRAFEDDCFDPYKHLLEQYLNQHWPKALSRRNSLFRDRTIQSHPWLALQTACRDFTIPKSHMRRAVEGDEVRSMTVQGPKRESVLVWKPDVVRLKVRLAGSLTAKDAADYLGVTKKQFGQLRQSGYFTHLAAPESASRGVWAFSKDELSKFLTSLVHSSLAPPEAMTLSHALRRFRAGVKEPLVIIIEAIREGALSAYAPSQEPTIRELAFDGQQFEDWYRDQSSGSELFSITEAAKRMGIHQEFAYQLANTGLLETYSSNHSPGQLVSQNSIDKFCSEYVLLRDLAREAGRSSASVMNDLASRGIRPVDADWDQQLRQKVYLAGDLG
ncbi:hypothetical protein ADIMK_3384 [Marinobacterium lacunae]|uniref:TniQ protein n=2 Tax=Marinobacterium lacunae TaxID=1232683 RepID=A0A081FVD8_9GAMM|nr:hypothetical protein ADIMK_3384 [Marinobacterium lacunae]